MPIQLPRRITTQNQKLKLFVYGVQGTGKTTLAASARYHPMMAPVLILNIEGGLLSVANLDGVDEVPVRNGTEMDEYYWAIAKGSKEFAHYQTIVIDSGTVFAQRALVEAIQRGIAKNMKRGKHDALRTLDDAQREDYGAVTNQVSRVFGWFRDLDKHVICTALEKIEYPPDGNEKTAMPVTVRPLMSNKLGDAVMGMYDHVWYKYTGADGKHYLLTQKNPPFMAKTRGLSFPHALGPVVDLSVHNLATIYDLLLRTETGDSQSATIPASPVQPFPAGSESIATEDDDDEYEDEETEV